MDKIIIAKVLVSGIARQRDAKHLSMERVQFRTEHLSRNIVGIAALRSQYGLWVSEPIVIILRMHFPPLAQDFYSPLLHATGKLQPPIPRPRSNLGTKRVPILV